MILSVTKQNIFLWICQIIFVVNLASILEPTSSLWYNDGCTSPGQPSLSTKNCSGHGNCMPRPNNTGNKCDCYKGFAGSFCQRNINDCLPNPCKNGGLCEDKDNDFKCHCRDEWTGKICSMNKQCHNGDCLNGGKQFNECEPNPCFNNGTCLLDSGKHQCRCAPGFSGDRCRVNINECDPMPCINGGTCEDGIDEFICTCPSGFSGDYCQIDAKDPLSRCYDTSKLTKFKSRALEKKPESYINSDCNFCECKEPPICSKFWCGFPNCLANQSFTNQSNTCKLNEICLANRIATCLKPPCEERGDCRDHLTKDVGTLVYPVPRTCWPNEAKKSDHCAIGSLEFDNKQLPNNTSVENICHILRSILAERMVHEMVSNPSLHLICDLETGTNNVIEFTISTNDTESTATVSIERGMELLEQILNNKDDHQTSKWEKNLDFMWMSAIISFDFKLNDSNTASFVWWHWALGILVILIIIFGVGYFGKVKLQKFCRQRTLNKPDLTAPQFNQLLQSDEAAAT